MIGATSATAADAVRRCSAASRDRDEELAGTGSTGRAFLLVENDGPWGVEALRDARMDSAALETLRTRSEAAGVRGLLVRRFGRTTAPRRLRVTAAYAHPVAPWAEQVELGDVSRLTELDLAALGEGRSPGLPAHVDPVFAVCTHGRHDTCCAEQGRPVAEALSAQRPEQTWECSHIGGDRYAANLVVLPYGLYYGRLDPDSAVRIADTTAAGRLDLDHLRGRSGYAMPVQAAEIALRRELDETRISALRLLRRERVEPGVTGTTWSVADSDLRHLVRIRTTLGEPALLTCRALRTNPVPRHEVLSITST